MIGIFAVAPRRADRSGMTAINRGFFVSAVIIGLIVAVAVWFAADIGALAPWARITYLVIGVLGPVVWTAVGIAIGAGLRGAGVARGLSRR